MNKAVSPTLLSVPNEHSEEGVSGQFTTDLVRDVDERAAAESAESRIVWLVTTPGFFGSEVLESASWRDAVEESGVLKCVPPVSIGGLSVDKHRPDLFNERAVHAFGYSVALRGVRGHLMCNVLVLEERLDLAEVYSPPSEWRTLSWLACLELFPGDEGLCLLPLDAGFTRSQPELERWVLCDQRCFRQITAFCWKSVEHRDAG